MIVDEDYTELCCQNLGCDYFGISLNYWNYVLGEDNRE